jgi:hypothetical protein
LESAQKLAGTHDVSKDEIRRHVRLTYLLPGLLGPVDEEKLPFTAGVALFYLTAAQQEAVCRYFCADGKTLFLKTD